MVISIGAAGTSISISKFLLILRLQLIQARVRSTIQRFGITSNPLKVPLRLTTSSRKEPKLATYRAILSPNHRQQQGQRQQRQGLAPAPQQVAAEDQPEDGRQPACQHDDLLGLGRDEPPRREDEPDGQTQSENDIRDQSTLIVADKLLHVMGQFAATRRGRKEARSKTATRRTETG